jgi:hypothetical protein
MNPNYPETFAPQFATRSRMVSLEINYPSLLRSKDASDPNTNPPYNASEPLRIAREVSSLTDLTIDADMARNEFVKLWDHYVNNIKNGAPEPNAEQKFDLDVILALVEFGNKLRENFIIVNSKSREERTLPFKVNAPLTPREFRRCAWALDEIPKTDKPNRNPENTAREFLTDYFLTNIDNIDERSKIITGMRTWRSQKRVAA